MSKHKNQLGEDGNTGKSCHSWGSTNAPGILGILSLQQFEPIPGTFVGMSQGFWQNQSPRPFQLPHLVEPVRKSPTPSRSSENGSTGRQVGLSAHCPTSPLGVCGCPAAIRTTLRLLLGIQPQAQVWWAFLESPVPRPVLCLWKACLQPRTVIGLASAEGMAGRWARRLHKPTLSSCFTPGAVGKAAGPQKRPLRGERPGRQWALAAWSLRSGVEKRNNTDSDVTISVAA